MSATGGCLCGAVTYTVSDKPTKTGACHCEMCRRWSGGVYMAIHYKEDEVTIKGGEHISRYKSSDWAERCFCNICGSNLFYHVTLDGPYKGNHHIGFGTLDDPKGIPLTSEIYVDKRPDGYAFAGELETMTEAEVIALFGSPE
ncbi:MAG: GFA family protein [Cognatishimia sp.]|uniref:GFA family protein n=1 Tax=Cognatishimia sp. 1_MG-2023 TaxID=3062642 RepID=UPI0026E27769|nr:GFA family protein [Cognatishimia sp. 1_MG-2023]MDO6728133.1 GFA family protein [Cognatishimia sp. 1_MG-2023]